MKGHIITLVTPIFKVRKGMTSNLILNDEEMNILITFLQERQRCLPYTKLVYNVPCIIDISWTISLLTKELTTVINTTTLILSKTSLMNVSFGDSFNKILHTRDDDDNILIDLARTTTPYIELPLFTSSAKWHGSSFHLKNFIEKELEAKILLEQVGNMLYMGVSESAMAKMDLLNYPSLRELIRKYFTS